MNRLLVLVVAVLLLPGLCLAEELQVNSALEQARVLRGRGNLDASIALLKKKLDEAVRIKGIDSDAGESAQRALEEAAALTDQSRQQARLYYGLEEVKSSLNFKPIMEAPLPEGFPPPGEVGKIIVKDYPSYRAARTSMRSMDEDNGAFGRLFRHITTNNVKMTAPVEMTFEKESAEPVAMAFLYESPTQGEARREGEVDVIDLPAVTVVSVGVRGNYTDARREKAIEKLKAWVNASGEFEIVGAPRLMGYNSPFVLPILRFAEVQIPVRKK